MPVYLFIEIEVKDPETYSRYVERVPEIIKKHGGRYLARGGKITPLIGNGTRSALFWSSSTRWSTSGTAFGPQSTWSWHPFASNLRKARRSS